MKEKPMVSRLFMMIAVTYVTTQGESYSYMRYIRRLDGTSLTLREYYNETMSDYFDVVFTRLEK